MYQMHQTMLDQLEDSRARMHRYIDEQYDELRTRILCGEYVASITAMLERDYSLDSADATFKGKKPVSIHFADGRELPVNSWKEVAAIILQDCISNQYCSSRMYDMAGSFFGRKRIILDRTPIKMDVPIYIAPDLYFEGKFDTQSLICMLKQIMDRCGYDHSGITLTVRDPKFDLKQEISGIQAQETESPILGM